MAVKTERRELAADCCHCVQMWCRCVISVTKKCRVARTDCGVHSVAAWRSSASSVECLFEVTVLHQQHVICLLLLLPLYAGIHVKGASERLLYQRDGLGWLERQLVQRCICGPKEM